MAEDLIRYDILAQEALRGVVRKVLNEVAKTGLPGEHHFFISFVTTAPGVRISQRLLDQYKNEMTIVLQNQYWDLKTNETGFEVGLSFDGQPEILVVPYSAIKGFFDPSVQFGLQFDVTDENGESQEDLEDLPATQLAADNGDKLEKTENKEDTAEDKGEEEEGENVVSLDSFRKKP